MKQLLMAVVLLSLFSLGVDTRDLGPQEVSITLRNGKTVKGEILAVRDSSIVVAHRDGSGDEGFMNDSSGIAVVPKTMVNTVRTTGTSLVAPGLFIGGMAGCLGGCAIGSSLKVEGNKNDFFGCDAANKSWDNTLTGGLVGCLAGGLAGLAVGGSMSDKGVTLIDGEHRDFSVLEKVAKYPLAEPEDLKRIRR